MLPEWKTVTEPMPSLPAAKPELSSARNSASTHADREPLPELSKGNPDLSRRSGLQPSRPPPFVPCWQGRDLLLLPFQILVLLLLLLLLVLLFAVFDNDREFACTFSSSPENQLSLISVF